MNFIPSLALTDAEAALIDSLMPGNQVKNVGSRIQLLEKTSVYIQKVPVAADATGGQTFLAEVSGDLADAWVQCTAANAGGTLTLRRATDAISSAIVCAVADALSRTTVVTQVRKTIAKGETLNVIANGALDRGILFLAIVRS